MLKRFINIKLHGLRVTKSNLEYEGSLGVDMDILEKAGLHPGELILVANINNGQRFYTYLIAEPKQSGTVSLNGAAARLGEVNDRLIVMSEVLLTPQEIEHYEMKVLKFDPKNSLI